MNPTEWMACCAATALMILFALVIASVVSVWMMYQRGK